MAGRFYRPLMRADGVPSGNWDCAPLLSKASPEQALGAGHVSKEGCTGCKKSSPGLLVPSLCSELSVWMGLGAVGQEVFPSFAGTSRDSGWTLISGGSDSADLKWDPASELFYTLLSRAATIAGLCCILQSSGWGLLAIESINTHQNRAKMQTLWPYSKPIHPALFLNETPRNICCTTIFSVLACSLLHRCGNTLPINSWLNLSGWAFCHQSKFLPFSSEKPVKVCRSCLQVTVLPHKKIYALAIYHCLLANQKIQQVQPILTKSPDGFWKYTTTQWAGSCDWLLPDFQGDSDPQWCRILACSLSAKQVRNSTQQRAWT